MTASEKKRLEEWIARFLRARDLRLVNHSGGLYQVTDKGGLRVTDKMTLEEVKNWIEDN